MSLGLMYKDNRHIFNEICGETPYLEYPLFRSTGIVKNGFSTRLGGVSRGCWSSLNLSFDRGDDPEAVRENFRRIGAAMGVQPEDMVLSKQTHTTNVRVMTEQDRGKGITRERDYTDVDGMITNVPGLCLVTSYADCVPLYFVDPVKKAIGLSHSGWRGTVGKIGKETVRMMETEYGSDPADILAAVGPSVLEARPKLWAKAAPMSSPRTAMALSVFPSPARINWRRGQPPKSTQPNPARNIPRPFHNPSVWATGWPAKPRWK